MKKFTLIFILLVGVMLVSCSAKQDVAKTSRETAPAVNTALKPEPIKKVEVTKQELVASKPIQKEVLQKTIPKKKPVVKKATKHKLPKKKLLKPKKAVAVSTKTVEKEVAPSPSQPTQKGFPFIALDEPTYNFGTIKEGVIIKRDFTFTNTGDTDLLIEIATGSCGCTVPEWPLEPIKPGETGVIHVTFDSTDKEYDTHVEVNIVANTEPIVTEIFLNGRVIPKRDWKENKE